MSNHFSKLEEIGDQIYVYRSFISEKELEKYLMAIENAPSERWHDGAQFQRPGMRTFGDPVFGNILKRIQDEVAPKGTYLEYTPGISEMPPGIGMSEHSDDCPHCKKTNNPDFDVPDNLMKRCVIYGMVVYLSNFTGGEIYYPKQNIEFAPKAGDLIIHSTNEYCRHGVKEVKTGIRYTIAPYIVRYINKEDEEEAHKFWENLKNI